VSSPVTVTGDEDGSMTYLSIGDFARASGLTAKALRLYDELELVVPAKVDDHNGYRWYAPEQLERARLVASLRLIGMPLYRIREIAALDADGRTREIAAYWRQVEADHVSRRAVVTSLVVEQGSRESTMTSTNQQWSLRSVVRHEQGGRSSQRDAVYAGSAVFAVADGLGSGTNAAATTITAIAALDQDVETDLDVALAQASSGIEAGDSTTLTALWFDGQAARTVHIGDCRLHRIRDGQVELFTRDHTLVAALIEEGSLTDDEAQSHPHRALLNRALAREVVGEPDVGTVDVRAGDRFALTSKGVHAVVELESLLQSDADLESLATAIVESVEGAGAPDNYSLVLVDVAE
jgi:serine/threonine protein phosphatase PrpC